MSKETSGAASSTIEIADYVGMLAPLGWVHQDEDGGGAEEALRYATKDRLGAAPELDGELQMLNERYLVFATESGEIMLAFHLRNGRTTSSPVVTVSGVQHYLMDVSGTLTTRSSVSDRRILCKSADVHRSSCYSVL